ncbi:hypothetical protein H0H87_008932 [Tephrocybe sp. NHM501043]|nr:hypothetical protein H0H87_008932 [Tephrocybe sp. NHM501043]
MVIIRFSVVLNLSLPRFEDHVEPILLEKLVMKDDDTERAPVPKDTDALPDPLGGRFIGSATSSELMNAHMLSTVYLTELAMKNLNTLAVYMHHAQTVAPGGAPDSSEPTTVSPSSVRLSKIRPQFRALLGTQEKHLAVVSTTLKKLDMYARALYEKTSNIQEVGTCPAILPSVAPIDAQAQEAPKKIISSSQVVPLLPSSNPASVPPSAHLSQLPSQSPQSSHPSQKINGLPYLHSEFRNVLDPKNLALIAAHRFNPLELFLLDTRESVVRRNAEISSLYAAPPTSTTPPPSAIDISLQRFPTLNSLLIPLSLYFSVLHASLSLTANFRTGGPTSPMLSAIIAANRATQTYISYICDICDYYDWSAVIAFHFAFHERRRVDMAMAQRGGREEVGFLKWGHIDGELMALHLFGKERNRPKAVIGAATKKRPVGEPVALSSSGGTGLDKSKGKPKGKKNRR